MAKQGNNAFEMREGLKAIERLATEPIDAASYKILASIAFAARNALAKPPRNCDVGTAQEQAIRFAEFCSQYRQCDACPLNEECYRTETDCEFAWEQMPYAPAQKGGAK